MNKRKRGNPRPAASKETDVLGFWGLRSPPEPAGEAALIRPTSDPGAIPRSLGDPPLPVRPGVAEAHLAAVYEEAVRAATALAAVNGILAPASDDADG